MNAEPKLQTMPEENRATSAEIIPLNICNNKSKTKKCEQCGKEFEVKRKRHEILFESLRRPSLAN